MGIKEQSETERMIKATEQDEKGILVFIDDKQHIDAICSNNFKSRHWNEADESWNLVVGTPEQIKECKGYYVSKRMEYIDPNISKLVLYAYRLHLFFRRFKKKKPKTKPYAFLKKELEKEWKERPEFPQDR